MEVPVWKRVGGRLVKESAMALKSLHGAYPESAHSDLSLDSDYEIDAWLFDDFPEDIYVSCGNDKSDPDTVSMMGACNFGNTEGFRRGVAVNCDSYAALYRRWMRDFRTPRSWKHQKTKWSWREKRRMRRLQKEHLKDSVPASFLRGTAEALSAYERYFHEGALP